MEWLKIRNKKDWITIRHEKRGTMINIISFNPKYKWDIKVTSNRNLPFLVKNGISKQEALLLSKKYIKNNP